MSWSGNISQSDPPNAHLPVRHLRGGQQQQQQVERKMAELFQLSEELAARKLKEKIRREKIRETEQKREQELRELADAMERKEQER